MGEEAVQGHKNIASLLTTGRDTTQLLGEPAGSVTFNLITLAYALYVETISSLSEQQQRRDEELIKILQRLRKDRERRISDILRNLGFGERSTIALYNTFDSMPKELAYHMLWQRDNCVKALGWKVPRDLAKVRCYGGEELILSETDWDETDRALTKGGNGNYVVLLTETEEGRLVCLGSVRFLVPRPDLWKGEDPPFMALTGDLDFRRGLEDPSPERVKKIMEILREESRKGKVGEITRLMPKFVARGDSALSPVERIAGSWITMVLLHAGLLGAAFLRKPMVYLWLFQTDNTNYRILRGLYGEEEQGLIQLSRMPLVKGSQEKTRTDECTTWLLDISYAYDKMGKAHPALRQLIVSLARRIVESTGQVCGAPMGA